MICFIDISQKILYDTSKAEGEFLSLINSTISEFTLETSAGATLKHFIQAFGSRANSSLWLLFCFFSINEYIYNTLPVPLLTS